MKETTRQLAERIYLQFILMANVQELKGVKLADRSWELALKFEKAGEKLERKTKMLNNA